MINNYYIYKIIRSTYSKTKRFYKFDKAWVFKNRALYYVLNFIYQSLGNLKNWEKQFVDFYENTSGKEFRLFSNKISNIVNRYFEYIYKTWDGKEYYNTYLQKSDTMKKVKNKFKNEIIKISKRTEEIFKKIL